MALLELHRQCVQISYKNKFFSLANLFAVICRIFKIIVPFLLAYNSTGFIKKIDELYEQPTVTFNGYYLFEGITNNLSQPIFCSNFNFDINYREELLDRCSSIKVKEIDENNDLKTDMFEFSLRILLDNIELRSFVLILGFNYQFNDVCKLEANTIISIDELIKKNTHSTLINGLLNFYQLHPVECLNFNNMKIYSDAKSKIVSGKTFKIHKTADILEQYLTKNNDFVTNFKKMYTVHDYGDENYYTINLKIKIPEHKVWYKTGFGETLKWALLHYLLFYFIVDFVVTKIERFVFENKIFLVYEINPVKNYYIF